MSTTDCEAKSRRRSVPMITAVLSLSTFVSAVVHGMNGAQQRADGGERARLDVKVSIGDSVVPDATVLATEERHRHVTSAKTDVSGRVQLAVPPGRYRVSAVLRDHPGQTVPIRARGGSAIAVALELGPHTPFAWLPPGLGFVSGRVVAANGEPVSRATVRLSAGRFGAVGGSGHTEADGSFRFIARAQPSPYTYNRVGVHESPDFSQTPPPIAFVPVMTELTRAVQVWERQETSDLEIRVDTTPYYRVGVILRDQLGGLPINPTLTLMSRGRHGSTGVRSDGTATFAPLPPGSATIWASADGSDGARLTGVAEVEIVDRPIDDVVITLVPGARLRGRVEFSGSTEPSHGGARMLILANVPGRPMAGYRSDEQNGRVANDGAFVLDGLLGMRCFGLVNVPAGWRLDAIVRAGRDITDEPITFASGQDVDDVVLRLAPGDGVKPRPMCDPR